MKKSVVSTSAAPAAIGPYSQAITADPFVFASGQIPLVPGTGALAGEDITSQTHQALKNLKAVLEAAGSSLDQVVKTTVFIVDMAQFTEVNRLYAEYFADKAPARSCVEVSKLPKGSLLEIEAIALKR